MAASTPHGNESLIHTKPKGIIVIADDSPPARHAMISAFEAAGFLVLATDNAESILGFLRTQFEKGQPVDMIITDDATNSWIDGVDFIKDLRKGGYESGEFGHYPCGFDQHAKNVPAIILTGGTERLAYNGTDPRTMMFVKPVTPENLLPVVEATLADPASFLKWGSLVSDGRNQLPRENQWREI